LGKLSSLDDWEPGPCHLCGAKAVTANDRGELCANCADTQTLDSFGIMECPSEDCGAPLSESDVSEGVCRYCGDHSEAVERWEKDRRARVKT